MRISSVDILELLGMIFRLKFGWFQSAISIKLHRQPSLNLDRIRFDSTRYSNPI
jgi:hypothetical protein